LESLAHRKRGGDVKKCIFQLKKHFNMFNFELSLKSNFVCELVDNWLLCYFWPEIDIKKKKICPLCKIKMRSTLLYDFFL